MKSIEKLTVLHAAETIQGGVETVLRQLLVKPAAIVNDVEFVFVLPDNQAGEREAYSRSPYNFLRTGRNLPSLLRFSYQFVRAVVQRKPNIVHLHSTLAGCLGRLLCILLYPIARPRVVYCPHAFSFLMDVSPLRRLIFARLEWVLSHFTAAIVCVSKFEREQAINNGLRSEKLRLIYNGTNVEAIPECSTEIDGPIRLLYVGRFDFQKGVDVLCDAMKLVDKPRFHLTIVGASVHGNTNIPPFPAGARVLDWISRSELDILYSESDVLVVPSRWEGFAMTPLEGMARGLPVIASDCTSLPEVVFDGANGYLFKTGSASSLASVLMKIEKSGLRMLGKRARNIVASSFSSEGMVTATWGTYEELISGDT